VASSRAAISSTDPRGLDPVDVEPDLGRGVGSGKSQQAQRARLRRCVDHHRVFGDL
jgi:hypothetical protein